MNYKLFTMASSTKKMKNPKTRVGKVILSETIDLCESDSGEDVNSSEKIIETITLDESTVNMNESFSDNYSFISDGTLHLSLTDDPSPTRPSTSGTKRKTDDESENDEEVQIVGIQPGIPTKRAKKSPALMRFNRHVSGRRQNQPFFFDVLGSANPAPMDIKSVAGRTIGKKKKRKSKLQAIPKNRNFNAKARGQSRSPPSKKAKKQAAKVEQTRQILRSMPTTEYAHNKFYQQAMNSNFPEKNNRKKTWVPLKDGKPKFRMEPINLLPVLAETAIKPSTTSAPASTATSSSIVSSSETVPVSSASISAGMSEGQSSSRTVMELKGPSGESSFQITSTVSADLPAGLRTNNTEPQTESVSRSVDQNPSQSHWSMYGSNAYHSGPVQTRAKGTLRPIVIDGSNVAMGHGNRKVYSCRGIQLCCDYFKGRGHSVVAFVPRYRQKASLSQDTSLLEELENAGIVKFTPSREVDGKRISSYDDRFIVQFAADSGGIIVSNDNFRDLYEEQPLWRETIRNRILQFTWINENYIMFPPDPLGCRGPTLDEFLRF